MSRTRETINGDNNNSKQLAITSLSTVVGTLSGLLCAGLINSSNPDLGVFLFFVGGGLGGLTGYLGSTEPAKQCYGRLFEPCKRYFSCNDNIPLVDVTTPPSYGN